MTIRRVSKLLPFLLLLVSIRALAMDCEEGNDYSLMRGSFGFRFDVQAPMLEPPNGIHQLAALRPMSVVGVVLYSGDGRAAVIYNWTVVDSPGYTRSCPGKLLGTYCAYPNGWVDVSLTNPDGTVWLLKSFAVQNRQELETMLLNKAPRLEYTVSFSQKRM